MTATTKATIPATDHVHDVDLSALATNSAVAAIVKAVDDRFASLEARVAKLEGGTPKPPDPPPTGGLVPPPSIDRTGASDVTTGLMSWLNGLPAGTLVDWGGGTYKVKQLLFEGKSLRFGGTGFLNFTTVLTGSTAGAIHMRANCRDMAFGPGLVMTGAVPSSDWGRGHTSQESTENNHAFWAQGVQGLVIDRVKVQGFGGDGVYSGGFSATGWTHDLKVLGSTFIGCGRMGVAAADGLTNAVIQGNSFDKFGWYPTLDIEPNGVAVGTPPGPCHFENILFDDNQIGRGNVAKLTFVVSNASNKGGVAPVVSGIVATGNRTMYADTPWNPSISGWPSAVTMTDNR